MLVCQKRKGKGMGPRTQADERYDFLPCVVVLGKL